MNKILFRKIAYGFLPLLLAVCLLLPVSAAAADTAKDWDVSVYDRIEGSLGSYTCVDITGLTPYVFMPTGAGSANSADFLSAFGMMERYGESNKIVAAINAGIFYANGTPDQFCYHYREADGVVICDGVVLKSTESIDHTECDIFVVDGDGCVGWADYFADADALASGTGSYYDIHGNTVTGKKIISAVTGFVPILVDGKTVYDASDEKLNGYDNYVAHYSRGAERQILGIREDGSFVILTNGYPWTLKQAAEAALKEGCVFAYNFDGGSSAGTVTASLDNGYSIRNTVRQRYAETPQPTFIVFTADNTPPVSAVPKRIEARAGRIFSLGATLKDIAAGITVTEYFTNADGNQSSRRLYSAMSTDPAATITHELFGGAVREESCSVLRTSVSPAGVLYYTKDETETKICIRANGNTREDGKYYDYSTGFLLETNDNLSRPGVKTIKVSYTPGGSGETLETQIRIVIRR